jgi:hypothetical protein
MARRIDAYRIKRGDNLGDPELWNRRLEDIDLRIAASEEALSSLDAVASSVEQVALDRINNVITPLVIETQERLASIPDLFSASSASTVTVGLGLKSFDVDPLARDTWAVSNFLYVEAASDPDIWMTARLVGFDRSTGVIEVDVFDFNGSGSVQGWNFTVSGRRGPAGPTGATGISFRGAYSAITAYQPRDVVRYDRSSWIAKAATTGNAPPALPAVSNTWWDLLVERGADGQETGAFETEFSETVTVSPKATFTISGGYSPEASMMVFHNGVKLAEEDYTADDGETLVLDTPAEVGDIVEFKAFSVFGIGAVLQVGLNLADLDDPDTALVNLGGSTVGRDVFKAASQAAGRSALGAAASSHQHPVSDVTGLQAALDGKAASGHTHGADYVINVSTDGNYVYMGWDGSGVHLQVDSTYQGMVLHTGNFAANFALRRVAAGEVGTTLTGVAYTSPAGSFVGDIRINSSDGMFYTRSYYLQWYWEGTWYGTVS